MIFEFMDLLFFSPFELCIQEEKNLLNFDFLLFDVWGFSFGFSLCVLLFIFFSPCILLHMYLLLPVEWPISSSFVFIAFLPSDLLDI